MSSKRICGKIVHLTRALAEGAKTGVLARNGRLGKGSIAPQAYYCEGCSGWHFGRLGSFNRIRSLGKKHVRVRIWTAMEDEDDGVY